MQHIIDKEDITKDRKALQSWKKQIEDTDRKNTYIEVEQRITDFIKQNKKTINEFQFDVLDRFMEYCKEYYK